jgi:uncharacterized protein YciW
MRAYGSNWEEVTYNEIDTADLLKELRHDTQQCAPEVLTGAIMKKFLHLKRTVFALRFKRVCDVCELCIYFF